MTRARLGDDGYVTVEETVTYRYLTPDEMAEDARANYAEALRAMRQRPHKVAGGPIPKVKT